MALHDEGPQVQPVGRPASGRAPAFIVLLAAIFVLVALAKPWSLDNRFAAPDGSHLQPVKPSATTAHATASPDPDAAVGMYPQCYATSGWRVATLERRGDVEVRTVWPVESRPAQTLAQALAGERLVNSQQVRGIGFCGPGTDAATRLAYSRRVSLWLHAAHGGLTLVQHAVTIDPALADLGEVYLAPPADLAVDGIWPPGEYAFKVDQGGGNETWFALRIVGVSPPAPSASPRNGAGTASSGPPEVR